jgi:hypothetical protein
LKTRISNLKKNDKQWWSLNRELLHRKARVSAVPPLRMQDGTWVTESKPKADLFAQTWLAKCELPAPVEDQFVAEPLMTMQHFPAIRARTVERELRNLDINKATGPDHIGARILKELSAEIAVPIAILCRRILNEACWPKIWKVHYLAPVFKRKSVYAPGNYRGVHLTAIASKVVERVIANPLILFLQQHGFGTNQWGFRKKCSSRDLVLVCVSSWILQICSGKQVAAYLSDISGAFDKVFIDFMMAKLHTAGVPDVFLNFLFSYLQPRIGYVSIEGVFSEVFELCDTVFQGTVLGPTLWNVFFHDVALAATWHGAQESMFADDLNAFKSYAITVTPESIINDMQKTRTEDRWGHRNRVTFDASKEHIVIIHPQQGSGDNFKLLGCLVDTKLSMQPAIDAIIAHVRPKINALLRTRGFYDHANMFAQYKTHIWGYTEYHNGAIFHAASSELAKLDRLQKHYVHELSLTEESAFMYYNFAPPSLRRDIGILGFLHKRVLGECHNAIALMFPFIPVGLPWHNKQLDSHMYECTCRLGLFQRSVFSMVHVYNRLPQYVVDQDSVSKFQTELTKIAKHRCAHLSLPWRTTFTSRR